MFDRDEQEISQMIESGLEAILSGEATLEEVLARHPEQAGILQPELEGALWLMSRQQEVEARPGFVAASRRRLVERIKAEANGQGARHALFGFAWPKRLAFQWVAAAAVILVFLMSAGGLVTISQSALPGDNLYAVKRTAEQVAYSLTISQVQRVEVSAKLASRRLDEVKTLIANGNFAAAETTVNVFEQQVNQTLDLLEKVSNAQSHQKLTAAIAFKEDLKANAEVLSELQASAPASLRDQLQEASVVATTSAATTESLIELIPGAPTRTPPPTSTNTAVPSSTAPPESTQTPVPPKGKPTDINTPAGGPLVSDPGAADPSASATLNAAASKTPRATKTDKPVTGVTPAAKQQDTSSNQGKSEDKGNNGKSDDKGGGKNK